MSPVQFRHSLIWSLPTLAVLLTYFLYKSRRGSSRSDPGGTDKGTRKTKKQEEASKIDSNLRCNNYKVQVSEIDSATSQEEALSSSEKDTVGPTFPEKQESVHRITVNVAKKVTLEPSFSLDSSHSASNTNKNIFKEETLEHKTDGKERVDTKLKTVKENFHITINNNCNSRRSTEDIFCNKSSEQSVAPETNLETIISQGTNSQIIVSSSTNFERNCSTDKYSERTLPSKGRSDTLVSPEVTAEVFATPNNSCEVSIIAEITSKFESQVTSSETCTLQDTNSQIAVSAEEDIQKVNSQANVLNEGNLEIDCPIVNHLNSEYSSELNSEVETLSELNSEAVSSSELNSEAIASVEINSVSGVASKLNSESGLIEVDLRTQCVDCNSVSISDNQAAVSEEEICVVEHCSVEESSSVPSFVFDNNSECTSQKETMPESIVETTKLESTSNADVTAKSTSEPMKPVSIEVSESSLLRQESGTAETGNMHSQRLEDGSGEGEIAAPKEDCSLEGKLAALELGKSRDSANHSPAEVMLASPSASTYSDEGSSDSGKGCSDLATPPSRTPASGSSVSGDATTLSVYEFVIPQHLVGRLIGRHGAFVHQIKAKTNASILIKRHPDTTKLKICAVEGTQLDIDSALEIIRKKFPLKHYPSVTLEQVCFVPPVPVFPVLPECLQLMLVEGVSNDVILSSLVTPCHFFLQQPTHPTYPALTRLNVCMNMCYSESNVPLLPSPINPGVICAAPTMGGWFRAQVVSVDNECSTCEVKFVDYGGYLSLEHSALRQIRSDFMTLPFQASECFLANVAPAGGEEASWSPEAATAVEELTRGQVLQAQVCDYTEDNIPNVFLYAVHCNQVVLVNQELVSRGFAEWLCVEEINDSSSS